MFKCGSSPSIPVNRGVKQGDPMSAILLINLSKVALKYSKNKISNPSKWFPNPGLDTIREIEMMSISVISGGIEIYRNYCRNA